MIRLLVGLISGAPIIRRFTYATILSISRKAVCSSAHIKPKRSITMYVQPELPPSYSKNISLYVRRRTVCLCCGA